MPAKVIASFLLSFLISSYFISQTAAVSSNASISGHVTVDGRKAAGVSVVASTTGPNLQARAIAKTVTDDDGNYRLTGLRSGRLSIAPTAKAYVISKGETYQQPGVLVDV